MTSHCRETTSKLEIQNRGHCKSTYPQIWRFLTSLPPCTLSYVSRRPPLYSYVLRAFFTLSPPPTLTHTHINTQETHQAPTFYNDRDYK